MNRLADTTWPEAAALAAAGAVLVIPVGATEQHGPHLPVTTDADIAVAVVDAAAATDPLLVVAPAVAFGSSGEHDGFAGTLSVGQDATEALLVELGRSATHDFAHVVLASAHGGNARPVRRALARLADEGHPVAGWSPAWDGDLHAGRTETSIMLAIDPTRVRLDAARPGDTRPLAVLLPLLEAGGVRAVSANGVLGDPTGASAAEGRALIARAAADLAVTVAGLRRGNTCQKITDRGNTGRESGVRT
ncbi:MAG: mycofactocin biosynthesis peptidyl-dipeptidase MftE [Acidimicrobiales bacterium]|jgi:creatinine amidohydrolase